MQQLVFIFVALLILGSLLWLFATRKGKAKLTPALFVTLFLGALLILSAFYMFQFGDLGSFTLKSAGVNASFSRKLEQATVDSDAIRRLKEESENNTKDIRNILADLKDNQYQIKEASTNVVLLNERVSSISNTVDGVAVSLNKSIDLINSQTRQLLTNISASSNEIEVLRLYFDAYRGNLSAFAAISDKRTTSVSRAALLAGSMADALWLYQEDIRNAPEGMVLMNSTSGQNARASYESIVRVLRNDPDQNIRMSAANDIAKSHRDYYVEDLVDTIRTSDNWKVQARAVRALSIITGHTFHVHPPYTDVQDWWNSIGSTNTQYRSVAADCLRAQLLANSGKDDDALALCELIVTNRPDTCFTQYVMAILIIAKARRAII